MSISQVHCQDILKCIHFPYSNPEFIQDMFFSPVQHYSDHDLLAMFIVRCTLEIGGGQCRCVNLFNLWNRSNQITDYP